MDSMVELFLVPGNMLRHCFKMGRLVGHLDVAVTAKIAIYPFVGHNFANQVNGIEGSLPKSVAEPVAVLAKQFGGPQF